MTCDHCNPEYYIIYGFCPNCLRMGECPLFEPWEGTLEEYEKIRCEWDKQKKEISIQNDR